MFRRNKTKLIELLLPPNNTQIIQPQKTEFRDLMTKLMASIANADERFQHFVQTKIDPLLGKTRNIQMQEIVTDAGLALSEEERSANQNVALGGLALGTALLAHFIYAPLIGVTILLCTPILWNLYHSAYLELRRTRRLGALHLTCFYLTVLWLGGYAAIGACGLFALGFALKIKALTEHQSRNNFIDIFQFQPKTVWIRRDDEDVEIEIPFAQLQVGDTIVLYAGQIIPVDGIISGGMGHVDQHMLTGESQPVEKQLGDPVMASTVVISGKIEVCVEKTGKETTAGRIGDILNQAGQHNTAVSVKAVELADRFAMPTLVLSLLSWPIIGPVHAVCLMGSNYTRSTYISAPLAVLNFLNIAATHGILVKDGSGLEQINSVDTIVFDKTGTLTIELPHVAQIHTMADLSEEAVLRFAAAAEVRQTHPIALAILAAAKERQLELPPIDQAHYEVGYGIKVWLADASLVGNQSSVSSEPSIVADQQGIAETEDAKLARHSSLIRVGSGRFMTMEGIVLPEQVQNLIETSQVHGHSFPGTEDRRQWYHASRR